MDAISSGCKSLLNTLKAEVEKQERITAKAFTVPYLPTVDKSGNLPFIRKVPTHIHTEAAVVNSNIYSGILSILWRVDLIFSSFLRCQLGLLVGATLRLPGDVLLLTPFLGHFLRNIYNSGIRFIIEPIQKIGKIFRGVFSSPKPALKPLSQEKAYIEFTEKDWNRISETLKWLSLQNQSIYSTYRRALFERPSSFDREIKQKAYFQAMILFGEKILNKEKPITQKTLNVLFLKACTELIKSMSPPLILPQKLF